MKKNIILIITATFLLFSCTVDQNIEPPLTMLEIRQLQTREYNTADTVLTIKSLLDTLQDEGFIIKTASLDLGIISAEKDVDIENSSEAFFAKVSNGDHAKWRKHMLVEISGNISKYGEQTKVRLNVQKKIYDNYGTIVDVYQIRDPEYYQKIFNKLDKAIFIQNEEL